MQNAKFICSPFVWNGYFCSDCELAYLSSIPQKWGFNLTKFLFTGEVLTFDG
jgi:hypothetical protein